MFCCLENLLTLISLLGSFFNPYAIPGILRTPFLSHRSPGTAALVLVVPSSFSSLKPRYEAIFYYPTLVPLGILKRRVAA